MYKRQLILNKQLLDKYFKNQCTDSEKEFVEDWILNKENKSTFENYIEDTWEDFTLHPKLEKSSSRFKISRSNVLKAAASLLVVSGLITYGIYSSKHTSKTDLIHHKTVNIDKPTKEIESIKNKEVATANSTEPIPAKATIAKLLKSNTKKESPKSAIPNTSGSKVMASKIGHLHFNEKLLSELSSQIDSNKLVLTMNMKEERFLEMSSLLKLKYGIILEPVRTGGDKNMYSARFEKVNIPELLQLMENSNAISYNIDDSLLQINL